MFLIEWHQCSVIIYKCLILSLCFCLFRNLGKSGLRVSCLGLGECYIISKKIFPHDVCVCCSISRHSLCTVRFNSSLIMTPCWLLSSNFSLSQTHTHTIWLLMSGIGLGLEQWDIWKQLQKLNFSNRSGSVSIGSSETTKSRVSFQREAGQRYSGSIYASNLSSNTIWLSCREGTEWVKYRKRQVKCAAERLCGFVQRIWGKRTDSPSTIDLYKHYIFTVLLLR